MGEKKCVVVSGASDDLCEIGGDFNEEFCDSGAGRVFGLLFDDGSKVDVQYTGGVWKVTPVKIAEGTTATMLYTADEGSEDRGEGYTDRLELIGPFTEVACRMRQAATHTEKRG